jgi:TolB protein
VKDSNLWGIPDVCLRRLDGELLAFGSSGALLVDAVTRCTRRLTHGADLYSRPSWSRDGRQLAFHVGKDVYSAKPIRLADTSSGRLRGLGGGWGDMAWSPGSRRIVHASVGGELDLIDAKTGKRTLSRRRWSGFLDGSRTQPPRTA